MKKLPLMFLLLSLAGCGNNGSDLSSGASSGASVLLAESTAAIPSATDSAQFLAAAYQDGQNEIQQAQLALQKSVNEKVRNFAQRIIDHHTAANGEIARLAQSKNIALPTDLSAEQKAALNSLSALAGDAFDKAYLQANVTDHETDVAAFKQQATAGNDAEIKAFADLGTLVLKTHLAVARDIHAALNPSAFLVTAYQTGLAEIQLARLAVQKATNADVRNFAQRMVNEHTRANNQIAALARQKNVTVPTALSPDQQAVVDDLSRFSGVDFDKVYMNANVIDHAIAVRLFRKQAGQGLDTEARNLARSLLPTLDAHLVTALEVDRNIEPSLLFDAYQVGKAEVILSRVAVLKTENSEVRTFAQKMVDDYTAAGATLIQAAQRKNVALPGDLSPEQILAFIVLVGSSGATFDQAYAAYSTRLHDKAVADFSEEAAQGTDAELRAFAQNALPLLTARQALARDLEQRLSAAAQ